MKPLDPFPWTREPDSEQCCGHRRATRVVSARGLVHATCDDCGHTWREVAYHDALPAHADVAARHASWLRARFAVVALLLGACTVETAGVDDILAPVARSWYWCSDADPTHAIEATEPTAIGDTSWSCAARNGGVRCTDAESAFDLICTPGVATSSVVLDPCTVQIACR